jgi:hypothetical protein
MKDFNKYQHIERINTVSTEGLLTGLCYIFYKLDGTNGSVWFDGEKVRAGSRNRELDTFNDNAGFYNTITKDERIIAYLNSHPNHRLFGEWLVPHSFKEYRDSAWRKFYIFDVAFDTEDVMEFLPYDQYKVLLDDFGLEYIHPLAIIRNPTDESLFKCLDKTNQFLVKDGVEFGEGIVIKNYDYTNPFGKQIWGKIITTEFREKHARTIGSPEIKVGNVIEETIVNDLCTEAFIQKEYSKFILNKGGWQSKYIGELLLWIYREFVQEEILNITTNYKNPKVNFGLLNRFVVQKIKKTLCIM